MSKAQEQEQLVVQELLGEEELKREVPQAILAAKKTADVWLSYRACGSSTIHSFCLSSRRANRVLRKLAAQRRVDYLQVRGLYETEVKRSLWKAEKKTAVEKLEEQSGAVIRQKIQETRIRKAERKIPSLSFSFGVVKAEALVACSVSGILGGVLELPALYVPLVYEHPLAKVANCLTVVKVLQEQPQEQERISLQLIAGIFLVFLKAKRLLKTQTEATATEQNALLQRAGRRVLCQAVAMMAELWDNPNVWNKAPGLSLDVTQQEGVTELISGFTKRLDDTRNPLQLSSADRVKYLQALSKRENRIQSRSAGTIRIYSAAAVAERQIKENKVEARSLFNEVAPELSTVHRVLINKTITSLLLINEKAKSQSVAALNVLALSTKYDSVREAAKQLIAVIEGTSNQAILDDLERFSESVSPTPTKTIAQLLAEKRIKREAAGEENENGN